MWFNPIIQLILQSPIHGVISKSIMLIQYSGRRSGKLYSIPVNYFHLVDDQRSFLATTSQRDRTWWRNFRGGHSSQVYVKGKLYNANTEVIEDNEDVARYLSLLFTENQDLMKYFNISRDDTNAPDVHQINQRALEYVFLRTVIQGT